MPEYKPQQAREMARLRIIGEVKQALKELQLNELPPENWTGLEGALKPTFLSEEVWYNARHETSA